MAPDSALRRLSNLNKPGQWLISAIESVQESNGPGRVDKGWFHPSDLGHTCDAFLAFKFLGAPSRQTIPARNQRIYDLGNSRDAALKWATGASGISLIKSEKDRKIELPNLHIRGELDDWVKNPISGQTMIVDYKTMNTKEFTELKEAKHQHVVQIHPYMFAKATYNGTILYENKDNQDLKALPADFNSNLWTEEITGRIERILNMLKLNHVQRTPISNEQSCPFFAICSTANIAKLKEESNLDVFN